ncbi:MAG: hypothetical protein EXR71_01020 [Myxococcales bacterium]|nr:hypothetical protein [Myxococcales bacterium]
MIRFLFPAIILAGCVPSGIFMITVPYAEDSLDCAVTLDENFSDGYQPDGDGGSDGPWTYESSFVGSDAILFFHISPTGDGAVLTWGNDSYPGVASGDGWTFSWPTHSASENLSEHNDGYEYNEYTVSDSTVDIHIGQALFAELGGTVSGTDKSEFTWEENDKWDSDEIGYGNGQIPSSDYLVYKDSGDLYPQGNDSEDDDCDDKLCSITITEECTQSAVPFYATRVEGNDVLMYNDSYDDSQ